MVEADGGTVPTVDNWGRRRFAYPINHKNEGVYTVLEIVTEAANLDELDRFLRLADDVVRHKLDPPAGQRGHPPWPAGRGRLTKEDRPMANGNTVELVGNLTRDPELRFTPNGAAVASFGLAVNRRWRNQQTNEWEEQISFFDIVCWRELAENVSESLTKGTRVMVSGRLEQRSWETAGRREALQGRGRSPTRSAPACAGPRPGDQERTPRVAAVAAVVGYERRPAGRAARRRLQRR